MLCLQQCHSSLGPPGHCHHQQHRSSFTAVRNISCAGDVSSLLCHSPLPSSSEPKEDSGTQACDASEETRTPLFLQRYSKGWLTQYKHGDYFKEKGTPTPPPPNFCWWFVPCGERIIVLDEHQISPEHNTSPTVAWKVGAADVLAQVSVAQKDQCPCFSFRVSTRQGSPASLLVCLNYSSNAPQSQWLWNKWILSHGSEVKYVVSLSRASALSISLSSQHATLFYVCFCFKSLA